MKKQMKKSVMTMMELVIVAAIIALISAVALPMFMKALEDAKPKTAKMQIDALSSGIDMYKVDTGKLPANLDALLENPGDPKWKGPYLQNYTPDDPWGAPYEYKLSGTAKGYEILSYGSDGQPGGEGNAADITNLPQKK